EEASRKAPDPGRRGGRGLRRPRLPSRRRRDQGRCADHLRRRLRPLLRLGYAGGRGVRRPGPQARRDGGM
ncbi:MAG: hypothetical protein AVDCRST_MAG22-527, partial [uncultured Rubrobacteraceae bacterium]